jgi:hypothetical protein
MTMSQISGALIAAIETVWATIQDRHPDVPDVVVTHGQGSDQKGGLRFGHFAPARWQQGESQVHELFIGGEGLRQGPSMLLTTLIHEAAHGAARTRGVKDTSRQGRYHNTKYRAIAEEFGLAVNACDPKSGWNWTELPDSTADTYTATLATLDTAIVAYRHNEAANPSRTSNNNGVTLIFGCARKIRASKTVHAAGPINCGLCDQPFQAEDQDEDEQSDGV